jgi:hypothetical protein
LLPIIEQNVNPLFLIQAAQQIEQNQSVDKSPAA